jgi:hypothetical protein
MELSVGIGNFPPEDPYRWYLCTVKGHTTVCKPVEYRDEISNEQTQVIPVHKAIPYSLDPLVIRWNIFQQRSVRVVSKIGDD